MEHFQLQVEAELQRQSVRKDGGGGLFIVKTSVTCSRLIIAATTVGNIRVANFRYLWSVTV